MKIIVDANIVFSSLLNSSGKIGDLLFNGSDKLEFIAPNFLRQEISKYYPKLCKISKLSMEEIIEAEYHIYSNIKFISE